jgi:hypothetical protein
MEVAVKLTLQLLSSSAERMPTLHWTGTVLHSVDGCEGRKKERKEKRKEESKKQTDTYSFI